MHPVPPPEVSYELHSWLVDLGTVKGRQSQNSKPHVLPGRLVANLVSGEAFVDLLNAIFSKHAVKQKLTSHAGQPQQTWTQVAKGLRRMSVELDNAALAALASGDQALVLELLQELHVVYQHWISQEAKRQRRARNRRVQSQQGHQNGYARAGAAPDASEKRDAEKRDAAVRRHAADRPKEEGAHTSRPPGKRSMPESVDLPLPGSVDVHPDMGRVDGKQHKPVRAREAEEEHQPIEQVADAPERKPWDALSSLSPDRDFSMASSAPELLGLSMMQQLRITPSQVQELLAENGRRLLRAFADVEHNVAHLSRWLGSLTHYGGAIAELLLLRPDHAPFTLTVLGHGLQSQSDAGEAACVILAGVCAALAGTHLRKVCADWLINSSGLADVAALMSQRPSAHGAAVSVMVSCYGDSLLQLTSQYLKQTVRGEQEYLAAAHHILRAMLSQKDLAEACHEQGVPSHFLARSLQRLGDERSTAGTLQAAALLATDLWLAGVSTSSPQEGLGDLLSALKTATQSRQGRCPHMVAFSCLARLLSRLCDNQDVEGTPAVYRTFVYALVECESHSSREFGTRCLLNLLEKYEGVPVGILAELSVKKFQVSAAEPLTVIDVELFLVIAKHPRCTDRHAELLAQVLLRCALENPDVGRAASLPLLVIFRRFAREDSLQALFEHFVQVSLTRLIQRGTPKMQVNQVHEVLAKTACMRVPSLDRRMRRLLQEVCKAYLSSYVELHPNLQAVLDLWPEDEQDLKRWAQAMQAEESLQSPAKEEAAPTPVSAGEDFGSHGLELRSISPSVHNDAQPRSHSFADSSTAQVAQLAKETESLSDELAVAKDKQAKALAEAEALRKELGEAKELQKKVEAEVEQLQERREEIMARRRQAASKRGEAKARKPAKAEPAASEDLTEAAGNKEAEHAEQEATMTLQAAKDSAREWFARGLRGGNQHGPAARAKLCKQLAGQLQEHAASVCGSATAAHIASVLERGRPEEEGPLICATMARELRGSRYEGLWISRKGPAGHYYLGDEHEGANLPSTDKDGDPIHPRVHAVVKVVNEQLVISGFFLDPEDDTMSPAKVPIGPFLSVYFEGMSVREASAAWKGGPPARPRPAPKAKQGPAITDPKLKELQAGLPPGWEVRESRSKKGIYFFAHPSSGRSQMERPRA